MGKHSFDAQWNAGIDPVTPLDIASRLAAAGNRAAAHVARTGGGLWFPTGRRPRHAAA